MGLAPKQPHFQTGCGTSIPGPRKRETGRVVLTDATHLAHKVRIQLPLLSVKLPHGALRPHQRQLQVLRLQRKVFHLPVPLAGHYLQRVLPAPYSHHQFPHHDSSLNFLLSLIKRERVRMRFSFQSIPAERTHRLECLSLATAKLHKLTPWFSVALTHRQGGIIGSGRDQPKAEPAGRSSTWTIHSSDKDPGKALLHPTIRTTQYLEQKPGTSKWH